MNIYVILLAVGINATRVVGFVIEEMTDLRPYVSYFGILDFEHHSITLQHCSGLPLHVLDRTLA
mgnify:FL=1|jgi:hypothetical protein